MSKKSYEDKFRKYIFILILFIIIALIAVTSIIIYYIQKSFGNKNNKTSSVENEVLNVVESYNYPEFDQNKIILVAGENGKKANYQIKEQDALGIFSAVISNEKIYIIKEDISGKFKSIYGTSILQNGKEYEISGINSKPIDIKIGYIGTDYKNPIVTILNDNGYVQIVKLKEGVSNGKFVASNNIGKNIVRIDNVVEKTNETSEMSIIITSQDGTAYNLKDLIWIK